MFKKLCAYLVLVLLLVSLCLAEEDESSQEIGRKKGIKYRPYKHKKHHLLHHGGMLYYLAFLAIKVKIVFLIGTMITFALFAGKIFALFRYGGNHFKSEPEKIYIQSDSHPTYFSAPEATYESPHEREHDSHTSYGGDSSYGPPSSSYGRDLGDTIFQNVDLYKNIVKRMDLTEFAFESMEMNEDDCRKRFVCEADFKGKNNSLIAIGMYIFNDAGLAKYRTKDKVTNFEDCATLFPTCKIDEETT